jgi:hypothetical protein
MNIHESGQSGDADPRQDDAHSYGDRVRYIIRENEGRLHDYE